MAQGPRRIIDVGDASHAVVVFKPKRGVLARLLDLESDLEAYLDPVAQDLREVADVAAPNRIGARYDLLPEVLDGHLVLAPPLLRAVRRIRVISVSPPVVIGDEKIFNKVRVLQ